MYKLLTTIRRLLLKLAKLMGLINTFILLVFSFYILVLPTSLLYRLFARSGDESRGWRHREPLPKDHFRKQY